MLELHDSCLTEWNLCVAEAFGKHNMIVGRDTMQFLQIDLRFSDCSTEWDRTELPFKDGDAIDDAVCRVKKIVETKYETADLIKICRSQAKLSTEQKCCWTHCFINTRSC